MRTRTAALTAIGFTVAGAVLFTALPDSPPASFAASPTVRELRAVAASPSGQPQLTVGRDGRAILSWLERVGESRPHAFRFAIREGDGWSEPQTIVERDDFFVNWADVPSVFARADGGGLVAHWLQKNGRGTYAYDVRLALSDAEARSWGAPSLPYADRSQTEHGFASFFDWPGGGTGVVWLDGRAMTGGQDGGHGTGGAMTLRAARIAPDGTIDGDAELDARVCECCPTAAIATARGALVAYRDRGETEIRDIAVRRLENGRWHGPTYVHADGWTINACPVNGPALAAAGDRVALAWFTAEGDAPRAMLAFSADGGVSFGAPVRVDDVQTLGRVDVVMLPDGRAVASWLEFAPGGSEFRARVVSADGSRQPSFVVAASSSDRQSGYPRMALAGSELVFAWTATRPAPHVKTAVMALP